MQCNYHYLWDNFRHHPARNHFSCSKSQEDPFIFCVHTGMQDSALHSMLKSEENSVTEVHFQSRDRNFTAQWQCRPRTFNIPCKNSSKKPQQGFPSLLLLAVAFKQSILPLVRACVMLQLASPCPAMSPADSDPELYTKICIPGLTFLASSSLWTCAMIRTLGWTWLPSTNMLW